MRLAPPATSSLLSFLCLCALVRLTSQTMVCASAVSVLLMLAFGAPGQVAWRVDHFAHLTFALVLVMVMVVRWSDCG